MVILIENLKPKCDNYEIALPSVQLFFWLIVTRQWRRWWIFALFSCPSHSHIGAVEIRLLPTYGTRVAVVDCCIGKHPGPSHFTLLLLLFEFDSIPLTFIALFDDVTIWRLGRISMQLLDTSRSSLRCIYSMNFQKIFSSVFNITSVTFVFLWIEQNCEKPEKI